ncbi:MAG: pitrilysin family protein [Candidatus Omnitrophica bacterium]|nr:pitrilysin family protein [Candidatus Omnitrophota bacterium]
MPGKVFGFDGPSVIELTLDNGLSVVMAPMPDKGLTSIYLKVRAGIGVEQEYAGTGITHFIEHMVFKGNPESGIGKLARTIKEYGGFINATTDLDTTTYFLTVPNTYAHNALKILVDAVMLPSFNLEEVERERSVIISEIRLHRDDPLRKLSEVLFQTAYHVHPYRMPPIGYEQLLAKLTREDLILYHNRYYVPNNMVLAIAGDVDSDKTPLFLKEVFARYARGREPALIIQREPEQISLRKAVRTLPINLAYFSVAYHSTSILDNDLFAMDVLAGILGAGDGSRLNTRLVKEKELAYSVDCENMTPVDPGLFTITGICDPSRLAGVNAAIREELATIKRDGVKDEECSRAKRGALTGYLKNLQTVGGVASSLALGKMMAGDAELSRHYLEGIEKVTPDDVMRVAKKYLYDTNATTVYLVPEGSNALPQAPSGNNAARAKEARSMTLDNGIRLIIKEEPAVPLVSITIACLGGLRAEPAGEGGISNLTATMLLKGTATRSEKDIVPALEDRGGSMNAFSGLNGFGISVECLKEDVPFAIALASDVIRNPSFPGDELKKEKDKVIADIKVEDDDIFDRGIYKLRKGIFGAHPYANRVSGEIQTVSKLSSDDLKTFLSSVLAPGAMVISVVGDVDPDKLLAEVKEGFSALPKNNAAISVPPEIPLEHSREETMTMPKEEAVFMVGFNGPEAKDPDRYPLDILFSVMSGHDGRLFNSIREKAGLSYVQGGGVVPGLDPGFCYFYVGSSAEKIGEARKIMFDQIRQCIAAPITDEEFSGAKNTLIGRSQMSLQTNGAKAFTMAMDELLGLGYDHYTSYERDINACTKDDVLRVAKKYLLPDRSYSITILPEGGRANGS